MRTRTFVLLLVCMLPLLAGIAADAKTSSTDIGKPVCTHFDDATKPVQHAAGEPTAAPSIAAATTATSAASTTTSAGSAVAPQNKSGGTAGSMRTRGAPRWQTFLPGMFR